MELKPTKQKAQIKPTLDGMGNVVDPDMRNNPFGMLARNTTAATGRRRQWTDTLGATPPRDGPFSQAARDVAVVNPPRSRQRRRRDVTLG